MNDNSNFFNLKVDRADFAVALEKFRKANEFTDVQLKIGDKLFDAHRAVLAIYSPVLKAMLSDQWSTSKVCSISEEFVDVDIVEDLLCFIYTGSIKLTPDNVHPVCVAAHFLQISTLLEPNVNYLCQLITVENVLTLFEFSITCDLKDLNDSCIQFVNRNSGCVFQNSLILEFSLKNFKDLIVGLKKFWAKKLRENTFQCIVRWTEKNLSERLNELPVLLKNIPLEELLLEFLTETVSNYSLVKDSISAIQTVSTALANYETFSNSEWQSNQNLVVIGGQHNEGFLPTMSCYDFKNNLWKKLPEMPSHRSDFGVTVVNQQDIIVCGGYVDNYYRQMTNTMEMFVWSEQTWIKLPEMPFACASLSIAMFNGHLYAAGGFTRKTNEFSKQETVQCYSFETKKWKQVKSMNHFLRYGKLVSFKNSLYAFGGEQNTVERYDSASDTWTIIGSKKTNAVFSIIKVHQNKIYAYHPMIFESFDPETGVWGFLPLPAVKNPSMVSLNGKLLAVGGYLKDTITDSIYEFDFTTLEWIEFGKMNSPLAHHSIVVGAFY